MPAAKPGTAAGYRPEDMIRLHAAVLGFGLAGCFGKLVPLGPAALVAGRAACAALTISLVFLLRGQAGLLLPRDRRDLGALPLGVLLAAHWWTFFQAVQVSTVGVALVAFAIAPIFVLVMESLWHGRWPGPAPALASLTALAGVLTLAPVLRLSDATVRGLLWGMGSGATYALLALLNRGLVATVSAWRLTCWQNAVAALVLCPALVRAGPISLRDWGLVALLGTVFTAGTHGLFLRSLRTVPAHLAILTCTLEPGYGILAAAVLLGERPSGRTLVGAALVAGAVALATLGARQVKMGAGARP